MELPPEPPAFEPTLEPQPAAQSAIAAMKGRGAGARNAPDGGLVGGWGCTHATHPLASRTFKTKRAQPWRRQLQLVDDLFFKFEGSPVSGEPRRNARAALVAGVQRQAFLTESAQALVGAPVHPRMNIPSSPVATVAPQPPPQKPASAQALAALASTAGSASAAKEASETPAQTAQEAAHGDQQAVRLQAARARSVANPSPPGTARLVKVTA